MTFLLFTVGKHIAGSIRAPVQRRRTSSSGLWPFLPFCEAPLHPQPALGALSHDGYDPGRAGRTLSWCRRFCGAGGLPCRALLKSLNPACLLRLLLLLEKRGKSPKKKLPKGLIRPNSCLLASAREGPLPEQTSALKLQALVKEQSCEAQLGDALI